MIRVNTTTIAEETILQEMQNHPAESQREAMIKASEALVIAELVKQRAGDLGIAADNDADERYVQQLLDKEVDMPSASESDCRHYYEQNPEKFKSSPLLAVRHILLAAAPEDEVGRIQAEDSAKLLIEQLKGNPELFSALAKQYSSCPSKETGGDLGQLSKGQTVPEFERQLFRFQPGLVASPVPSRYGVHVVMVDQHIEGRQLTYDMVSQRIMEYLNEKVKRKGIAQYIESLIMKADIEGYDFSVSDSPLFQ